MKEHNFFAPGRVNIIGEHIDYNGGYVLPCTLEMGTKVVLRRRSDNIARLISKNFPDLITEVSLDNVRYDPAHDWANYPLGIVRMMQDGGRTVPGFELYFDGNIPNGAGLSSSASIEMATAAALNTVFDLGYAPLELVLLAQKAENEFCGVNCGIMDQFAVGMGQPGHAIYLQCGTLEHRHIPMNLKNYTLVVMNTNKRRALNESKYNERRAECEQALEWLNTNTNMSKERFIENANTPKISADTQNPTVSWKYLADLTPDELQHHAMRIPCPILFRRARHVVTENNRVKQAVTALEKVDTATLGALLNASHASLRDDYEVTGYELDTLAAEAQKHPACIGARMTGAGFGGCAIALVEKSAYEDFIRVVGTAYENAVGYAAGFYTGNKEEPHP